MFLSTALAVFSLSVMASLPVSPTPPESIYTNLSENRCKTFEVVKESGSSVQRCAGVAGYNLLVEDDDARQSVTVLTPAGKKYPLHYWQVITTAFSYVGDRAEWRVARHGRKIVPLALIVRVYANENPEAPNQRTSYLAVAKITPGNICVTDKIKVSATANLQARQAADASANKPCLQ
jgi:hypothetical protein